jgi:uncharacterized membrane protein YozB (DUF420 family)
MALLDNPFAVAATVSLIIQIAVLSLLFYGYMLKRKQKFRTHGLTMLSAVILHAITIFAVMVPSFALGFSSPATVDFTNIIVITALVHTALGVTAFVLGIWIAGSWHLQENLQPCFKKKMVMRATITIWATALILGIALYVAFHGPLLLS